MGKILIAIIVLVVLFLACCGITTAIFLPSFRRTTERTVDNSYSNNQTGSKNDSDYNRDNDSYTDPTTNQDSTNEPATLPEPNRNSSTCSVISQTELPTNWPDDFPIYPGANVTSVKCAPTTADLYEVRMLVTGEVAEIDAYYNQELTTQDWTVTDNNENDLYDTYSAYMLLNAEKRHPNTTRQIILDIRKRLDNEQNGQVEIIYREREW